MLIKSSCANGCMITGRKEYALSCTYIVSRDDRTGYGNQYYGTGYGAGTDPADCNEHPGFFNQ